MSNNARNNSLNTSTLFNTTLFTPDTKYRIQHWTIPGLVVSHQQMNSRSGPINLQGDSVDYNPLTVKLLVDEKLNSWKEIVSVFQKYQIPGTNTCIPITGESIVEVYDSKNNYLFKVIFHNCYLHTLSDLDYTTTDDNEEITLDLSIVYDFYTIE
jgi:hypothetical protein